MSSFNTEIQELNQVHKSMQMAKSLYISPQKLVNKKHSKMSKKLRRKRPYLEPFCKRHYRQSTQLMHQLQGPTKKTCKLKIKIFAPPVRAHACSPSSSPIPSYN